MLDEGCDMWRGDGWLELLDLGVKLQALLGIGGMEWERHITIKEFWALKMARSGCGYYGFGYLNS